MGKLTVSVAATHTFLDATNGLSSAGKFTQPLRPLLGNADRLTGSYASTLCTAEWPPAHHAAASGPRPTPTAG